MNNNTMVIIRSSGSRRAARSASLRRLRPSLLVLSFVLTIVGAAVTTPSAVAHATSSDSAVETSYATALNSISVIQTSTLEGLAPGVAPVAITGLIINNGPDSTVIAAVDVEITAVTRAFDAAPGSCGPSDYVLLNPRMMVGRTLAASGGSTNFAGASIGFNDTTANQDACQRATVTLLYTAVPGSPSLSSTGLTGDLEFALFIAIALVIAGATTGAALRRKHKTTAQA